MARGNEEIKVGAVVVVGAALLLAALVFVGGVNLFRQKKAEYTTHFKFAGGLEPGSYVRFGGLKVGTIQAARIDPQDLTRIRVTLEVKADTPIRINSKARISSLGFLGENYLEVSPGTREAALLPAGSDIPSVEIIQLPDVFSNVNNITVNANELVNDLDDRILVLSDNINQLIKNVNEVVGQENREHFNSLLANADGMLKDGRPHVDKTLSNLETASGKLTPTIDNLNATVGKTNKLAEHLDAVVVENRQELHNTLLRLETSLADAQRLITNLDDTLDGNRGNLDETLENLRVTSQNLKELSDTLKQRPYSLIRIKTEKDRLPPAGK
ncbi:MAG: MlaD family protein [Terriglobia bacterium]|jgi:phospholipid/cholesterol/gamma-HCH transport system substrate-binding protein